MVDTESRLELHDRLKSFIDGEITNDEFENTDFNFDDPGIWAIYDASWYLYSDCRQHKAVGKYAITEEAKESIYRWLHFLRSDIEYTWPEINNAGECLDYYLNKLTFGIWGKIFKIKERHDNFESAGDIEYWPFISKEQYEIFLVSLNTEK